MFWWVRGRGKLGRCEWWNHKKEFLKSRDTQIRIGTESSVEKQFLETLLLNKIINHFISESNEE